jgi:hypothetical protein
MLSSDSPVKRHVLADDSVPLPSVSMSASTPGEESTLGERLTFAFHKERHRGSNALESALMAKYPEVWRSRGFISSYISGRRGKNGPKPTHIKIIADFLHVSFEWLLLGSGPMRRGGRGDTAAEQAMFIARDLGIRDDAWEIAWARNKDREDSMSAEEWFDAIRIEAAHLEKSGVPRPEKIAAKMDDQARVRRAHSKKKRAQAAQKETRHVVEDLAVRRAVGGGDD